MSSENQVVCLKLNKLFVTRVLLFFRHIVSKGSNSVSVNTELHFAEVYRTEEWLTLVESILLISTFFTSSYMLMATDNYLGYCNLKFFLITRKTKHWYVQYLSKIIYIHNLEMMFYIHKRSLFMEMLLL